MVDFSIFFISVEIDVIHHSLPFNVWDCTDDYLLCFKWALSRNIKEEHKEATLIVMRVFCASNDDTWDPGDSMVYREVSCAAISDLLKGRRLSW